MKLVKLMLDCCFLFSYLHLSSYHRLVKRLTDYKEATLHITRQEKSLCYPTTSRLYSERGWGKLT